MHLITDIHYDSFNATAFLTQVIRACWSFISTTAGGYFCVRQGGKHGV